MGAPLRVQKRGGRLVREEGVASLESWAMEERALKTDARHSAQASMDSLLRYEALGGASAGRGWQVLSRSCTPWRMQGTENTGWAWWRRAEPNSGQGASRSF